MTGTAAKTGWDGHYLDGRTPAKRPVFVTVGSSGLVLQVRDGPTLGWRWEDVRQTQGFHHGELVRFERGDGLTEAVVVEDGSIMVAVQRHAGASAQRFADPRIRRIEWPLFIGSAVAVVAAVYVGFAWALPGATDYAADRIPTEWEDELGRSVARSLAPPEKRCEDPARLASIRQIVSRLAGQSTRYDYRIAVARNEAVNAFAAPGGHLVVFDGLLRRTERPEELAGVLAHEMEHVEQRHATRALLRELSGQALVGLVAGDASALETAAAVAGRIAGLRYNRRDEEAADLAGMARLAAARIDPQGAVTIFKVLQEAGGHALPEYLSTHPDIRGRIDTVRRLAREVDYVPVPLLPGRSWKDIKQLCG